MEHSIKTERIQDSVAKRKAKGGDLGGRRETIAEATIRNAMTLTESGKPAAQVAREMRMSRATLYRRMNSLT
jgi:DNA invertase Pin-like site-specific DNA recombinase